MAQTSASTKTINHETTKQLIFAALIAALTCVSTMIIKIPTPTNGYIHPGDGFVLLSGLLLGPLWGSLAAGLGSALSDLIGGYLIYAPATLIIKGLTAFVGYYTFKGFKRFFKEKELLNTIISGTAGETIMVLGYFIFEIFMLTVLNSSSLSAGVIASLAGIIPNIIQGIFGIVFSSVLYPILKKLI